MKAKTLTHGCGITKSLPGFENIKIYNKIEVTLEKGEKVTEVHKLLKETIQQLNASDLVEFLEAHASSK